MNLCRLVVCISVFGERWLLFIRHKHTLCANLRKPSASTRMDGTLSALAHGVIKEINKTDNKCRFILLIAQPVKSFFSFDNGNLPSWKNKTHAKKICLSFLFLFLHFLRT